MWIIGLSLFEASGSCPGGISVYPYAESFESGAAGWTSGGTNNDWQLGTPAKAVINGAGDGITSWITGGLIGSAYSSAARSWLQSPCFDLSSLSRPEISFLIFWDTEYQYDGGNLQYSTNGTTWQTLGRSTTDACIADNWYTINAINNLSGLATTTSGWSGTVQATSGSCRGGNGSGSWKRARYCLQELAGESSVTFRFTFGSGTTCNDFDGIAMDLFEVYDLSAAPTSISFQCVSSRTIVFTDNQLNCRASRSWDFGDGSVEPNNASTISHTYSSQGSWNVVLTANHSCRGTETSILSVSTLSFSADVTPVSCLGSSDGEINLQLSPATVSGLQVTWSDPQLSGSFVNGLSPGNYPVTISAMDACPITDTVSVLLNSTAAVQPELGPDGFFCPQRPGLLNPLGTYFSYLWQNGSSDSVLVPNQEGQYWVRVSNAQGCFGADTVQLALNCLDEPVFPSAFTPNDDMLNDFFQLYVGATTLTAWYIYDRWGHVIFKSTDAADSWDGKGFPEGIYLCLVEYISNDGSAKELTGRVTLIR